MRILVVDDDPINRFLLTNILESQGFFDTYEAKGGRIALELAEKIQPDLVLLDVLMPEINGYEVAPLLKKMSGDIYLPIIFITALADEAGLVRCLEVGGDDFFSKPFDEVILMAKIRVHLRTRQLSQKAYQQNKKLSFYQNSVQREHEIVEHIFKNVLTIDETLAHYIDYQLCPASDFNGDLFLIRTSPSGGFYFLMGDFTGHGLASSIGAIPVSQGFKAMCQKGLSVMEIAETINQTLLLLLPDNMFFAAILVEIDASGKRIDVWNGGMPHLVLQNSQGDIVKRFESKHMSMGILEADEFEADIERYEAQYGDRLIGFSDGLVEIQNVNDGMLGEEGVESWLIENPSITAQQVINKTTEYLSGAERLDDITLVFYIFQKLSNIHVNYDISPLPLEIKYELTAHQLKTLEPIASLIDIIANQLGVYGHHSALFTALHELYNNALDHGVLKMDSALKDSEQGFFDYFSQRQQKLDCLENGKITIITRYCPKTGYLSVKIKDSGKGFDEQIMQNIADTEKSYGRGIALVKALSDSLQYSEGGSQVEVVFKL